MIYLLYKELSRGGHSKRTSLLLASAMELVGFTKIVSSFPFMLTTFNGIFVVWKCSALRDI